MEWKTILLIVLGFLAVGAICFAGGVLYRKKVAEREIGSAEAEATRLINEAIRNGENRKKEMLLEAKDEIHKSRTEHDREVKERRAELTKQERRLEQKETTLDRKTEAFERKEEDLNKRLAAVAQTQAEAEKVRQQQLETLEQLSGLTQEQAKQYLLENPEIARDIEGQVRANADKLYTRRAPGKPLVSAAPAEAVKAAEQAAPAAKLPDESDLDIMVED